ncbi:MAG: hypothetical protein A2219_02340 [Elusimicrobia bacterium RIFOXYA2_FULL_50_26]|nr:MAG: hypothetical protein A2219_02340 [Elusimicrobia bacterium RIFOXYA2_FULL_50_26]OGS24453.1 MAG: hypothetical protein A2314_06135 [Elusimicrobia bacterium RIFOXYB2_FULL_50_12]
MIPLRNIRRFFRKTMEQPAYAMRVAAKRLGALLSYHAGRGNAPLPEAITIFMTHRCNLRCKMCGQWGDHGVSRTGAKEELLKELSTEQLTAFIEDTASFMPNITLFGGEPLLHRGALDLIRTIKSKGMHCLVITNGSLIGRFAPELVEAGLDELNISLDGNEETHDAIRGMKGLFSTISGGISGINALKLERGIRKPLINLQCTINKDNYGNLEEMLNVAETCHANSITFHHLIFLAGETFETHKEYFNKHFPGTSSEDWKGFVFDHGLDIGLLRKKIAFIKSNAKNVFVNFYPNFTDTELNDYYGNPRYIPSGYAPRCQSPWIACYLFPDGEVRPCLNIAYSFGNVQKEPFKNIWNGPAATAYRRRLKKEGLFPACIRCTELYRY